MSGSLHLTITSPFAVLVDEQDISSLRAEDASGSFGILPGHVDLLTVLPVSVVRWTSRSGKVRYCALRGGVLTVSGGLSVAVACRRGTLGDDMARLANQVEALKAEVIDAERRARANEMRMHARAVRQLVTYLDPNPFGGADGLAKGREFP